MWISNNRRKEYYFLTRDDDEQPKESEKKNESLSFLLSSFSRFDIGAYREWWCFWL